MQATNTMVRTIEKNGIEAYLQKFERFENEAKQPSWVFPLRKAGLARFAELGFPGLKDEDWRFTNVGPITKLPFEPVFEASSDGLGPVDVAKYAFGTLAAYRLVFVNGHYIAGLSTAGAMPQGMVVQSLGAALAADSGMIEKHLGRYAQTEARAG